MDETTSPYTASANDGCLRQGEILLNVIRVRLHVESIGGDQPQVIQDIHPYVVVLSQDCDLEQDYRARRGQGAENRMVPDVLLCKAVTAEELSARLNNRRVWDRIVQNKDERDHFLQRVDIRTAAGDIGLPELGVDFKRFFSIPTEELYRRIEKGEAKRPCRLSSPYEIPLSTRFAYYVSRVALPTDHASE